MKYIEPAKDRWHRAAGEDGPIPSPNPAPDRLLTLEQWHAVREHWPAGLLVALQLANDVDIAALEADLPRVAMVALHFPKWVDGRAYSQARLLRARYRYAGEVRATGEVVADMLPLLERTGFDAVQLRADQKREAAEEALGFFRGHYQGDVHDRLPLFARPAGTAERLAREAEEFVNVGASI
jgi:uncharacterized protein (DUF934 family)